MPLRHRNRGGRTVHGAPGKLCLWLVSTLRFRWCRNCGCSYLHMWLRADRRVSRFDFKGENFKIFRKTTFFLLGLRCDKQNFRSLMANTKHNHLCTGVKATFIIIGAALELLVGIGVTAGVAIHAYYISSQVRVFSYYSCWWTRCIKKYLIPLSIWVVF